MKFLQYSKAPSSMAQDRALLGRLDTLLQFYHKRNMSLKIIELQWINLPHCSMKIYSHHAGDV